MADELLSTLLLGNRLEKGVGCDTGVDQLSRVYSVRLLLLAVVMTTTKQYLGNPVECFCPAEFSDSQVSFTNAFCWVSSTYYLSTNEPIVPHSFDHTPRVSFYQWVPLLFLLQACVCRLPSLAWTSLISRCGLNVPLMFEVAASINKTCQADEREANLGKFVELFDRYSCTQRHHKPSCYSRNMKIISRNCFLLGGKPFGNFLCNCYILCKLLCVGMCVLQVALTDWFLGGRHFYWYGYDVLHGMIENLPWLDAHHFPPVTLCEVDIRQQSRVHSYVVQCVLSVNVFYEKIFVLLWFWWAVVFVLTSWDALQWLCGVVAWRGSVAFVNKRLLLERKLSHVMVGGFVKNYLRRDGVLLLRLLSRCHGDVLVGMLLEKMWPCYVPGKGGGRGGGGGGGGGRREGGVKKRKTMLTVKVDSVSASNSSTHLI